MRRRFISLHGFLFMRSKFCDSGTQSNVAFNTRYTLFISLCCLAVSVNLRVLVV